MEWSVPVEGPLYPAEWGNRPKYVILHHSATPVRGRVLSAVAWALAFHKYHAAKAAGPRSCPYHLIVSPEGWVARGRALGAVGGHAGRYYNRQSVGVCLVGDFDHTPMATRTAQLCVSAAVVCDLLEHYRLPVSTVLGHWEANVRVYGAPRKTCPGSLFDMPLFRYMVTDCLAGR